MQNSNIHPVSYRQVNITDGFWAHRQQTNKHISIHAVYDRFADTGRIEAFKMNWKEGMPNQPHIFWDSDVAKWMQSAAYIIGKEPNCELEDKIDALVDLVATGQGEDGYFNIYFTVVAPDLRFTDRSAHELYCAGHLIEAAVAYYEATGKERFLKLMRKYADYIDKVFRIEHSANFETCGHEEIELALYKLYQATGEVRYLKLGRYFIDQRGTNPEEAASDYNQDHMPVREQVTAEGHCVRGMYLYAAMADVAKETKDLQLFEACEKIWDHVINKRMYITGGLGSTHVGERFTYDYDLPNKTAYAETCASIGLFLFARRMLCISPDSKYADAAEIALYNGILSGVSIDGEGFFYENPLYADPDNVDYYKNLPERPHTPIYERKKVFDCSCCPPNITRLIANLGSYLYSQNEDTIFIHHYMTNVAALHHGGQAVSLRQSTHYPWEGHISVILELEQAARFTVAVRIPGWCDKAQFKINGELFDSNGKIQKGYLYVERKWSNHDMIEMELLMPILEMQVRPEAVENSGKIALQRGPVIYCLEQADNGKYLNDILLPQKVLYHHEFREGFLGGSGVITASAYRSTQWDSRLYRPYQNSMQETSITAIPYYGWANRGKGEMTVWIGKEHRVE